MNLADELFGMSRCVKKYSRKYDGGKCLAGEGEMCCVVGRGEARG